jgi:hypothetical protein
LHLSALLRIIVRMLAMFFVVEATDDHGNAVVTEPLTRLGAVMKLWEFKTSGCTDIRVSDAATGAPADLLQTSDDEPAV